MKNKYTFLFDLDSTITKAEILPTIAKKNNKENEMRELTEKTMMGDLLFEESLTKRVQMLNDIPVSEVAELVQEIPVSEKLVNFLNENKERCYIVTSNLDVWICKLMKKIGMEGHYFCSNAEVKNNKIVGINQILIKESIIKKFKQNIVATGDGSNDRKMLENADIGIGYGGVRDISPAFIDVIDYAFYDEEKLYEFLNVLAQGGNNEE